MKTFYIKFKILFIAVLYIFIFVHVSTAGERVVWSSQELGVRFSYDSKWIETTPTQDSTVVAIVWLSKKTKGLLATCYLISDESSWGQLDAEDVHSQMDVVGKAIKKNELKRCYDYKQMTLEKRYADNYPVIYLARTIKIKGFEEDYTTNVYSITTAWNNREISFACSSNIPVLYPQYSESMEKEISKILRTLQFDRK